MKNIARRHPAAVPLAALVLLGTAAVPALGVVRVGLGGGSLAVVVDTGADQNATHGVVVQPFTDLTRDGFRVRQDAFGVATITSSDADCFTNPIVNDVVCSGARGSLSVVMRGGADRVTLRGDNASADVCFAGGVSAPFIAATVDLGGGDDVLTVDKSPPCAPGTASTGQADWSVIADGEAGADRLRGGSRDDTLFGGSENNDLEGGAGNDTLRGGEDRDDMDGGPGNDTLRGGDGLDAFNGGEGDDLFHGGLNGGGPDVFVGGPGVDTVDYGFTSSGVTVTIFDPADVNANGPDGAAGENDAVQGDVENVVGSGHDDSILGNNLANRLDGSDGGDTIAGGAGPDVLLGGGGNDAIDSQDGERDPFIDCGPGTRDRATIDLVDRTRPSRIFLVSPVNCESVLSFATDDTPPGRLLDGVLRVRAGGVARARLACPRTARVACRGSLSLRRVGPGASVLRRARYSVARGATGTITIRVPASLRGLRAILETTEKGISRKGPRSFVRTVRVR